MTKKSHKLFVEDDFNFFLIGISSHENDYRLSWAINTKLKMALKRTENLQIHNSRIKQDQEFSLYQFTDPETLLHYNLIANRCDNGFLLEEMKNIDYVLKIAGDAGQNFPGLLADKLKKIDIITTAFEINPAELKSKKKLLF
jgi:hypothetical protein